MSYRIVRHYYSTSATPAHEVRQPKVMQEKVTLQEARAHCQRPDTRGPMRCSVHGIIGAPKNLMHDHQGRATSAYWDGDRPAFCPTCGEPTVADWFDGFAEN